jgi:hypothetical protein
MTNDLIGEFVARDHALVVAAAGCGKTELIARAIGSDTAGRNLVLTHTHAGVRALRDRLRILGVPLNSYAIDTIAGLALRYAISFPRMSGCAIAEPTSQGEWAQVYESAVRVFEKKNVRRIFSASYSGLYVDEYQDCSIRQHSLVMTMADLVRSHAVGDPLQGIFDFTKEDPLVDWARDVYPRFKRLPDLEIPYRWRGKNEPLGEWMTVVRRKLIEGDCIELDRGGPVRWVSIADQKTKAMTQIEVCKRALSASPEGVVVIRKWADQAHKIAKRLGGRYRSMEEVECKDLQEWCEKLEQHRGYSRGFVLLDFIDDCITKKAKVLERLRKCLEKKRMVSSKVPPALMLALLDAVETEDVRLSAKVLRIVGSIPEVILYRRELYREMVKVIENFNESEGCSLRQAAWRLRDGARRFGRFIDPHVVSRTLLIKGLEFDHAILPNVSEFDDPRNLYVALTRGSRSLTILSREDKLQRNPAPGFS